MIRADHGNAVHPGCKHAVLTQKTRGLNVYEVWLEDAHCLGELLMRGQNHFDVGIGGQRRVLETNNVNTFCFELFQVRKFIVGHYKSYRCKKGK